MKKHKTEIRFQGLYVTGIIVSGDSYGDASIPRGVMRLAPYVQDLEVLTDDGTDITDMLKEIALEDCAAELIEQSKERAGPW